MKAKLIVTVALASTKAVVFISLCFIGFKLVDNHTVTGTMGGLALIVAGMIHGVSVPSPKAVTRWISRRQAAARSGEDGQP